MMKNSIIGVLVAGLALTTGGWAIAHDNQNMVSDVAMKQKVDIQDKSTKIANLDVVIVKKDKKLEADKLVIEKLNDQLQTKSELIEEVKNNNTNLEAKLAEVENQLRKKNERLALKKAEEKRVAKQVAEQRVEQVVEKSTQVVNATNNDSRKISTTTVSRGVKSNKTITMEATGYIAFCDTGCTGITATGINVSRTPSNQIIAVDPSVIPLHTKVRVTLQNGESFYAIAEDTGGHIKGGRIDILKATHGEAVKFGRQRVTVTILD